MLRGGCEIEKRRNTVSDAHIVAHRRQVKLIATASDRLLGTGGKSEVLDFVEKDRQ
jgi:hypothetical protein